MIFLKAEFMKSVGFVGLAAALVATFSCFRFTPGLAFGEKDNGHY
jgi:hypothetical protein